MQPLKKKIKKLNFNQLPVSFHRLIWFWTWLNYLHFKDEANTRVLLLFDVTLTLIHQREALYKTTTSMKRCEQIKLSYKDNLIFPCKLPNWFLFFIAAYCYLRQKKLILHRVSHSCAAPLRGVLLMWRTELYKYGDLALILLLRTADF